MSARRIKTRYAGVFYREVERIGGAGAERVYYIVFKQDGKVLEEKVGRQYVDDMTPARAAGIRAERIEGKRKSRREIRREEEEARRAAANRWTIARLWEEYKAQNPGLKGMVTDENRFQLHLAKAFGKKEPGELAPLDVDRLRVNMMKTRKPGTVRNTLELLRRIINFGEKKQLCPGLGFTIQMPRVDNIKTEDLTPDELAALLQVIDAHHPSHATGMMLLALYTGMRRGEMFRLRWDDIDEERGFIRLRDPKGGKEQSIPLNASARAVLDSMPRTDSPQVFPGRGGNQRTDINKQLRKIKELAGLPEDFRALHGLRHVYASMLASTGQVDMYSLQKLLTHKSAAMTQRYAHLRDEALQRAAGVADEMFRNLGNTDLAKTPRLRVAKGKGQP